jgi:hypothetical protein
MIPIPEPGAQWLRGRFDKTVDHHRRKLFYHSVSQHSAPCSSAAVGCDRSACELTWFHLRSDICLVILCSCYRLSSSKLTAQIAWLLISSVFRILKTKAHVPSIGLHLSCKCIVLFSPCAPHPSTLNLECVRVVMTNLQQCHTKQHPRWLHSLPCFLNQEKEAD